MNFRMIRKKLLSSIEVKNAGWIIGGRIVQMVLALLISIWTARYLGPGNYGVITYASAYVSFFSAFSSLGINDIIIKEFIDHPDEQGIAIGTTFCLRLFASVLSELIILGIISVVDRNEPITIVVTALYSIVMFFQVADTINYWFQSRYQSKIVSLATLFAYIVTTAYRSILLILNKDVKWFALASAVESMCIAFAMLIAYKKCNGPKLTVSIVKAKALLKKSYNFIIVTMMVSIYEQTDKIMLKLMYNEAEVGFYSTAFAINGIWTFVLGAIISSVSPTIIRCEKISEELFERKNRQLCAVVIYVSLFMAVGFTLFGEKVVLILYGEAYLGAVAPLKILCWYTIFFYLAVARNIWLIAKEYHKYLKYICGGAAIANIVLNFVLIPILGASGAAIASLITQILGVIIIPYAIKEMRPSIKLLRDALFLRGVK